MKANELMIGDWVNFLIDIEGGDTENDQQNDVYQPMQVGSISCLDEVSSVFYGVKNDISQLRPISITAEILEKNGFSHIMYSDAYYSIMIGDTYVELRKYENMAVWFNWKENNDGVYADYILPIPEFIHQLQHALRLCNIEKEIEL